MNSNRIIIVQGAQYGSEAKGQIAAIIAEREEVEIAVRTGATNAGHTVYYNQYKPGDILFEGSPNPLPDSPVKMQQLPTAWVVPDVQLVLGAGAIIDPVILARECEEVTRLTGRDIRERLLIDYRAGVHTQEHAERSKISGRHHAIGATGKGCSEALIDRIRGRGMDYRQFGQTELAKNYNLGDTARHLNVAFNQGKKILLEGTQGTMLDLYLGPYPYTTHKQTGPGQWMLEAGLSPALATDIVSVVRTHPIRVAGNSGPLPFETSWPQLARTINSKREKLGYQPIVAESAIREFENAVNTVASMKYNLSMTLDPVQQHTWRDRVKYQAVLSELNADAIRVLAPAVVTKLSKLFEFTTVTKKLRRIAPIHFGTLSDSSLLTRPHRVVVTFLNYEFPKYWYDQMTDDPSDDPEVADYIDTIATACYAPVTMVGFGPESRHHVVY